MAVRLARNWWVLAVRGCVAILFGLLLIAWPNAALRVAVLIYGAFALVDGLAALVAMFLGQETGARWWALLLEGIVGVTIGVITFINPDLTEDILILLIGFWSIATGVFEIAAAWQLRKSVAGEIWLALAGIVSVLFGVMVLFRPVAILVVVMLIGCYAIFFGITLIALSLRLRNWHSSRQAPSPPG